MACYHPLPAIPRVNGGRYRVGKEHDSFEPFIRYDTGEYVEQIKIPCGQCIGCRLDYSRRWADRCALEAAEAPTGTCWFVTLTYDPKFENELKNKFDCLSLQKQHLVAFNKKLLRYWDYHYQHQGIRFYGAGEYGDLNFRPHFHVLYFNLPIFDLTKSFTSKLGDVYYKSSVIESIWKFGFVDISEFSWKNAAYTARYIMKKQTGKQGKEYYQAADLQPEFTQMSRMPGIARLYYENHKEEIYRKICFTDDDLPFGDGKAKPIYQSEIILPDGKIRTKNSYFDYLMKKEDPDFMIFLGEGRKHIAELRHIDVMQHTDLSEDEYLLLQENVKQNSLKRLTRLL